MTKTGRPGHGYPTKVVRIGIAYVLDAQKRGFDLSETFKRGVDAMIAEQENKKVD